MIIFIGFKTSSATGQGAADCNDLKRPAASNVPALPRKRWLLFVARHLAVGQRASSAPGLVATSGSYPSLPGEQRMLRVPSARHRLCGAGAPLDRRLSLAPFLAPDRSRGASCQK